jgi:imidazolonepropionase-like amidohydrolase
MTSNPLRGSRSGVILRGLIVCALLAAHADALAQTRPVAFVGARVHTMAGEALDDGVIVVRDGRIVAVGPRTAVNVPDDADVRDVAGRVIVPGLVDTHSHLGGPWAADGSEPIQPECRTLDAINVRDAGFQKAQAGGITTANVMPGSGHLLSGQTLYLKLREATP